MVSRCVIGEIWKFWIGMTTLTYNLDLFDASLIVSALSCGLVTGFILTYAILVMPGLSKLTDRDFLRAFQVTDEIIQNNQPLFMLIWVGSIISVISTIFTSVVYVGFPQASSTLLVCIIYLVGVQGVTITIHIPLNNRVQNLQVDKLDDQAASQERSVFEPKWNRFNYIRSSVGFLVCLAFLLILAQR